MKSHQSEIFERRKFEWVEISELASVTTDQSESIEILDLQRLRFSPESLVESFLFGRRNRFGVE